jgi:hypothetical protein
MTWSTPGVRSSTCSMTHYARAHRSHPPGAALPPAIGAVGDRDGHPPGRGLARARCARLALIVVAPEAGTWMMANAISHPMQQKRSSRASSAVPQWMQRPACSSRSPSCRTRRRGSPLAQAHPHEDGIHQDHHGKGDGQPMATASVVHPMLSSLGAAARRHEGACRTRSSRPEAMRSWKGMLRAGPGRAASHHNGHRPVLVLPRTMAGAMTTAPGKSLERDRVRGRRRRGSLFRCSAGRCSGSCHRHRARRWIRGCGRAPPRTPHGC